MTYLRLFSFSKTRTALLSAALIVSGATFAGLKATPPKGIDLSGAWKLNAELSDDPQKIMDDMRARMQERRFRGKGTNDDMENTRAGGRPDPRGMFRRELETKTEFKIQQQAQTFTLKSVNGTDSCKTKEKAQVSTFDGGLADRECGWSGKVFVIEIKPIEGPRRYERYELSQDGKQLITTTEIKGDRLPGVKLRRVYDRA